MGLVAAGAADAENAGFRGARLAFQACGAPFRSVVGPGPARVASESSVALSRCDRDKRTEQRIGARATWRSPARARSWPWPGPIGTGTGRCLQRPRASTRAYSLGTTAQLSRTATERSVATFAILTQFESQKQF